MSLLKIRFHLFAVGKGFGSVCLKFFLGGQCRQTICSPLLCFEQADQLQEGLGRLVQWPPSNRGSVHRPTLLHNDPFTKVLEKYILPDIRIRNSYNCSEQLVGFE